MSCWCIWENNIMASHYGAGDKQSTWALCATAAASLTAALSWSMVSCRRAAVDRAAAASCSSKHMRASRLWYGERMRWITRKQPAEKIRLLIWINSYLSKKKLLDTTYTYLELQHASYHDSNCTCCQEEDSPGPWWGSCMSQLVNVHRVRKCIMVMWWLWFIPVWEAGTRAAQAAPWGIGFPLVWLRVEINEVRKILLCTFI